MKRHSKNLREGGLVMAKRKFFCLGLHSQYNYYGELIRGIKP
jgi:hypothetical protein